MKYLVDTSALVRIIRKQVDTRWGAVINRGLISICEPAMTETLLLAETRKYTEMEQFLADRYLAVTIPENVWDVVAAIRRDLAPYGAHRGLSVADLVIAATAIRLKLTVLHEDGDFETVTRFVPELQQRRISAGPE